MKREKGYSLMETIVAVALLGIIAACFLSGAATTSSARATADEKASGKILAESLMEDLKKQGYASSYEYTIPDEFDGYEVDLDVQALKNAQIQKITVTINHHGHEVFSLEGYKVKRDNATI